MKVALQAERSLVLVLDVQSVFASPEGPFANSAADDMIASINELLQVAREASVPVVHSRYLLRDDLADAGLLAGWDVDITMFTGSSPMSEIDPRLEVAPADLHSEHHRPSAFVNSDLDALLRSLQRDQLIVCGLSVNNAVAATTRDAFARDVASVVPREATGAAPFESPADVEAGFRALDAWTADVAPLSDVERRLR